MAVHGRIYKEYSGIRIEKLLFDDGQKRGGKQR